MSGIRGGLSNYLMTGMRLQTPLLLAFFTTIGLGADVRTLGKGGKKLLILLLGVIVALLLQNAVGLAIATSMDLNPLMGLLGGSATLAGGHGTGAAYGKVFGEVNNLQGSVEVAMACATFGLILGGVMGGPIARWLIHRHDLKPGTTADEVMMPGEVDTDERRALSPESLMETVLILMACLGIGGLLSKYVQFPGITLPTFVWCLLTGIVLRNSLSLSGFYKVDGPTIELIGTVSLSLFLAMALMSLRLWELVSLALPILVILAVQTLLMAVFAAVVTFRLMGKDYDAAVIATVSAPARRIQQAAAGKKIRFLQILPDVQSTLTDASSDLVPIQLPAGTYPNQREPIDTVAVTALLVAPEGLPKRDVEHVLTAMFAQIDFLDAGSAAGSRITRSTAKIGVTIPMHPAAIEFFGAADNESAPETAPEGEDAAPGTPPQS